MCCGCVVCVRDVCEEEGVRELVFVIVLVQSGSYSGVYMSSTLGG